MILDMGPALAFLAAYFLGGIYTATVVLIVSLFAVVLGYWLLEKRLHKAHLTAAVVALVLGGLTLWIHDPVFIKLKPSAVYGIFALALLGSQCVGDKVLLARIPQKAIALPDPLWRKLNFSWGLFFIGCAALNFYIAQNYDEATWVKFKTFGFTALMFVFLLAHVPFVAPHLPQEGTSK